MKRKESEPENYARECMKVGNGGGGSESEGRRVYKGWEKIMEGNGKVRGRVKRSEGKVKRAQGKVMNERSEGNERWKW